MLKVNDVYTHKFSYSQQQVEEFARVTGDNNPVHTNAEFAATTMFKVPIMHGMLGAALFSKIFGTLFPGDGTIYLSQSLNFLKLSKIMDVGFGLAINTQLVMVVFILA